MSLPPFPDIFDLTQEAAGKALLGWWIGDNAEQRGIAVRSVDDIPKELTEALVSGTSSFASDDVNDIDDMALASALNLAAKGEFARAGKLLKRYMLKAGQQLIKERLATIGARVRAQRRGFSNRGNASKKESAERKRNTWRTVGKPLRVKHPSKSNSWLAAEIAKKTGDKENSIRAAIVFLGLNKQRP